MRGRAGGPPPPGPRHVGTLPGQRLSAPLMSLTHLRSGRASYTVWHAEICLETTANRFSAKSVKWWPCNHLSLRNSALKPFLMVAMTEISNSARACYVLMQRKPSMASPALFFFSTTATSSIRPILAWQGCGYRAIQALAVSKPEPKQPRRALPLHPSSPTKENSGRFCRLP